MVDYQSYAQVIAATTVNHTLLPVNHIWLRTSSNPADLARVRTALNTSPLLLDNLSDRRALSEALRSDPLVLNLAGLLAISAIAMLLLALAGSLLISWLSVQRRLADFTVLRALGATPAQTANALIWEQGMIYSAALLFGIAFGTLLVVSTIPTLVFTTTSGAATSMVSSTQLYALQRMLPLQIVVPPLMLGFVLLGSIAICIVVLAVMIRVVLSPSMRQVLRLDEDRSTTFQAREDAEMVRLTRHRAPSQGTRRSAKPTVITLALWQLRKAWFFLLVLGIGLIAAVTIICSVPLFTTIARNASLHETLNASADTSTITLDTSTQGCSSKIFSDVQKQVDPVVQQYIGPYLAHPTPYMIRSAGFTLESAASPGARDDIQLVGTSMDEASSHLTIVQGQLPRTASTQGAIDSLLTPETARLLHLAVGSTIRLRGDFFTNPAEMFGGPSPTGPVTLRIVGLFNIAPADTPYWHGEDFLPIPGQRADSYTLLVPSTAFLTGLDQIASNSHRDTVFSPQTVRLTWYYHLDSAHIAVDQVDDLSNRVSRLRTSLANTFSSLQTTTNGPTYPYLVQVNLFNPVAGSYEIANTLDQFRKRSAVITIPMVVLTLMVFGLILFFSSLVANLLVDQQAEAIAILRSRGASISQIFGALLTQCVALGVIALIIGPVVALAVVSLTTQRLLGPPERDAITLITGQPVQTLLSVSFYALATVLVAIITMAFMLWLAARKNTLAARREAARTTQRPLWQRLNLDAVAALIALLGYAISLYLVSINNLFDTRTSVLVVAPLFLLIAIFFLFLRFFPALLQSGARLAIAFTIFTLVLSASQQQHISDIASYESGADFSGDLPINAHLSVQQETALYNSIAGINSTTVGFTGKGVSSGTSLSIPIEIRAVDARTFAHTGIWTLQDSSQSLTSLMTQLVAASSEAIRAKQVPVIIDTATARRLELQPSYLFAVIVDTLPYSTLNCQVIAVVQHIPTVNSGDASSNSGAYVAPGGILLDYSTYATIYKRDVLEADSASSTSAGGVLSGLSSDEFYVLQRIIPAQVIIPLSLGLAFAALVAICVVTLWIMANVTLRPSMSQTLWLNED
jgi:ABC-type antimicrobial peptide transport system permease subunit